jgi:hypothetical protein
MVLYRDDEIDDLDDGQARDAWIAEVDRLAVLVRLEAEQYSRWRRRRSG